MQIASKILFFLNALIIIAVDAFMGMCSLQMTLFGLMGVGAWFIAYFLSKEILISKWAERCHSPYKITIKRLKYANYIAICVWIASIAVAYALEFAPVVDFVNWLK